MVATPADAAAADTAAAAAATGLEYILASNILQTSKFHFCASCDLVTWWPKQDRCGDNPLQ